MSRGAAVVIGAGPAGLMAAETLAEAGVTVTVYDRMPTAGRKFLMAGRGGLNLTHSEAHPNFLARYRSTEPGLVQAIAAFPPERLRAWCEALGQPTFIGSSGRVFPRSMKASPLLRAWLRRLAGQGIRFRLRHRWLGWTPDGTLLFDSPQGRVLDRAAATVLALGGGSWPHLGSDSGWTATLASEGIPVERLRPSNCGFRVDWSPHFRDRFEGAPLHNVALHFGAETARGEALITRGGLEGGAVYALSGPLRDAIARDAEASLLVDLRPDVETDTLARRLSHRGSGQSLSTVLRKRLKLAPAAIGLLNEAARATGAPLNGFDAAELAQLVRGVPVRLRGTAPLARAISSAGGVRFDGLDRHLMLRARPGVFIAGEMLDWEAPTGGYLLQACFATGHAAGLGALAWLGHEARR